MRSRGVGVQAYKSPLSLVSKGVRSESGLRLVCVLGGVGHHPLVLTASNSPFWASFL